MGLLRNMAVPGLLLMSAAALPTGARAEETPVPGSTASEPVKVQQGQLQGRVEDGLTVYRGVPFAAAPVGELRWRPPSPAAPWEGVRQADRFGSACVQAPMWEITTSSEDCLYLNIWTPAQTADALLPVMVWIHGGGFAGGGTAERLYQGDLLAKKGVVLVSIGYRLGPLGYLAHPELSAESPEHVSGNYGLLDMIEALRWIRTNVAAFGGDPNRVTIFGESAGGIAVSMLSASPLAEGLFSGAISQSGGSFGPVVSAVAAGENVAPLATAEQAGEAYAAKLGATGIADLRRLPAEKLLLAGDQNTRPVSWPIMDGRVIPDDQYRLYQAGKYNDTPILVGYNSDEGALFGAPPTVQAYRDNTQRRYGPFADELLMRYPAAGEDTVGKPPRDLIRDTVFGWHTWTWARLQAETGKSKAFLYYFDQPTSFPPDSPFAGRGFGAIHGGEVPHVFGHFGVSRREPATAEDSALSETMMTYWTNFAKTGDPNGPGLQEWPAYDGAEPRMMHFASGTANTGSLVDEDGMNALGRYFEWRRNGSK